MIPEFVGRFNSITNCSELLEEDLVKILVDPRNAIVKQYVQMFEEELAAYTGSKYAVSVDSCTNALFLVSTYLKVKKVTIPSQTYLSVPMSIMQAGGEVVFDKSFKTNSWQGIYQLKPYPIYDAAKRFTKDMYIKDSFMCLSFQSIHCNCAIASAIFFRYFNNTCGSFVYSWQLVNIVSGKSSS